MGKVLSAEQVDAYRRDGIHFPVDVLAPDEAAALRARFEDTEAEHGGRLPPRINQKPHLLYPWIDALIRHPRVLDAVEDVLGPDLLCWSAQFFSKNARDPSYVSWHQDGTYWGLSSPDVVTAWVALTPSVPENGCMKVVPGTHLRQVEHVDTFDESNLLSRGQEIRVEVKPDEVVPVILRPGQMSLHHVLIFHGSEPNASDDRRIGFAIRYIPTHVRQVNGPRESATLVRGVDRFGHFDLETAPEAAMHPDAVARHAAVVDRQLAILYAGAARPGKLGATIER
ncbi:MAG TPA: phytanoyl-CoA dioxygenase family protein [Burkholderiaceae bacterium]|nr:phytanoyl-CoA dioxygenase family protein [Burkholderiaceae bacterium]